MNSNTTMSMSSTMTTGAMTTTMMAATAAIRADIPEVSRFQIAPSMAPCSVIGSVKGHIWRFGVI
jgi:hypothetical protein